MPLAKMNKIIPKLSSKESNTIQANTEKKQVQKSSVKNVTLFQEQKNPAKLTNFAKLLKCLSTSRLSVWDSI